MWNLFDVNLSSISLKLHDSFRTSDPIFFKNECSFSSSVGIKSISVADHNLTACLFVVKTTLRALLDLIFVVFKLTVHLPYN